MLIVFNIGPRAYLPEVFAYSSFFRENGIDVEIVGWQDRIPNDADVVWSIMGFRPGSFGDRIVIHEYASMSTDPLRRIKDALKKNLNGRPSGRVFLNEYVREQFSFSDKVPYIERDMGVHSNFFECSNASSRKEFDLVYTGSLDKQRKLEVFLSSFCKSTGGGRLLLIGEPDPALYHEFKREKSLVFSGRVPYEQVPALASTARFGLNFLPLRHPYLHQASTKVLEYCAMGLGVVSVDTPWVNTFFHNRSGTYLSVSDSNPSVKLESLQVEKTVIPDVSDLEWNILLQRIDLIGWLDSLIDSKLQ